MLTRFDMNQVFETVFEQMLFADKFLDFIARVNGSLIKVSSSHISLYIYIRVKFVRAISIAASIKKDNNWYLQSMRIILFPQYTRKEFKIRKRF